MWKYELFSEVDGEWRWRLRADGMVLATSEETFGSRLEARREVVRIRAHAGAAKLPAAAGVDDVLGEVLERISRRDEEEQERRTSIAVLN
ncbi:MAG TPA: DUF1508 domain-containing protein [Solirubrobacterales bacterium]|jgi:uncharacterized protein YegP (UPF0339 family)|nr:DUF1508 domain-containing protein [Solirubrobacterales bacterium]